MRLSHMQNITSTVSHEMKTPLGLIQQFVMLLKTFGTSLTEQRKSKHFLKLVEHQTYMLIGYVNDLLDLKQILTGLFQRKISVFDPNKEVFELIIEMFREQTSQRGIKLTFEPRFDDQLESNLKSSLRLPKMKGD